ncbi:MAG: glycosyltransferase [Ruminococcaceae bacterium]|nr:glycosyltransferase [Oscillospiraceae bacterium]
MKKILLSFVIPCYRSELTIEKVIDEIISTVSQHESEYDYEIICVNDCSPDKVLDVLKILAEQNPRIKVIDFAKNMGKHSAILAGYAYINGDYIINIDDDFQCPVYELWRMLKPVENDDYDCSTAKYYKKKQSFVKNVGSNINLIMASIMLNKPKKLKFENFTVLKRYVVDEIVKYNKPYPYLEGLIYRVTTRISTVDMNERDRGDDKSTGFTLKKSISLWLNGFTSFSIKPLRISTVLGFVFALFGFVIGLIIVISKIIHPDIPAGYTSLISVQLLIGGILMILLGLIGEYVGRIYICLNNTPQYVIRNTINISNKDNEDKRIT